MSQGPLTVEENGYSDSPFEGSVEVNDELNELLTVGICGYASALVVAYGISYLQGNSKT